MAKSNKSNGSGRSEPIIVTPENGMGNAVLAAWQGIYNLFGGSASFEITPDGVMVNDFTVDAPYDPAQIAKDVSHRNRRLDLLEVYPWIQGEAPSEFTTAQEITQWTVQFLRGAVDDNSSRAPKYVRDASAAYKAEHGFAKKRGPRKKIFRAENLGEIDETTLANVQPEELEKLQETLARALEAARANTSGESQAEAAVSA